MYKVMEECSKKITESTPKQHGPLSPESHSQQQQLPHYNQIMEIIRPLRYSGLQSLLRPEVKIQLNLGENTWTLKNIHRFNQDGTIIIEDKKYGLCGELAAFTSRRIQSLLSDQYHIQFIKAAESGFFLGPKASHIVLQITPQKSPNTDFILDPSFQRYDTKENFDDYLFYEQFDELSFLTNKEKDVYFPVGHGTPVLIHNDILVSLGIEKVNNQFDAQNFSIALSMTRRYKFSERYLFALRKNAGKTEWFENKVLIQEAMTPIEYSTLRLRLLQWFADITQEDMTALTEELNQN